MRIFILYFLLLLPLYAHSHSDFSVASAFKTDSEKYSGYTKTTFSSDAFSNFKGMTAVSFSGEWDKTNSFNSPGLFYGIEGRKNIQNFPYNASFTAGTIKFSGGISRLRHPALSSPSPLKKITPFSRGIKAEFPSISGTSSPGLNGFAFSLEKDSSLPWLPEFEMAIQENGELFYSIKSGFKNRFIPFAAIDFTGGLFRIESPAISSSWFSTNPYYKSAFYSAGEIELSIVSPGISFKSAFGIHEHPFGNNRIWSRAETSLKKGNSTVCTGIYKGDQDLITVSGSKPENKFQFYIIPQYSFYAYKTKIAAGVSIYQTIKSAESTVLKAEIKATSPGWNFQLEGGRILLSEKDNEEWNIGQNYTLKTGIGDWNESSEYSSSKTKNTFSINQALIMNKSRTIHSKLKTGLSFTRKNKELSGTAIAEVQLRHSINKIKTTVTVSAEVEFLNTK